MHLQRTRPCHVQILSSFSSFTSIKFYSFSQHIISRYIIIIIIIINFKCYVYNGYLTDSYIIGTCTPMCAPMQKLVFILLIISLILVLTIQCVSIWALHLKVTVKQTTTCKCNTFNSGTEDRRALQFVCHPRHDIIVSECMGLREKEVCSGMLEVK